MKDNPREEVNSLASMVRKLISDLKSFYAPLEDTHAYSVEGINRDGGAYLKSWLVEPAEVFEREILQRDAGTVLTSATLAVSGSFDYVRRRLGFDRYRGTVREFMGAEIFDYAQNALIYVESGGIPAPTYG